MSGEGVEREAVLGWWGVAACGASVDRACLRCGGPWARLGAWAPSLVCGGFARRSFFLSVAATRAHQEVHERAPAVCVRHA